MQFEQILVGFLFFLCGISIGNFVNVCIYRMPKKENLVKPRSYCAACGHPLAWYDCIPVFSWIALLGSCRYCKTKISRQYPLVELINGVGYVWMYIAHDISLNCILYCLTFSALVTLAVIDWRTFEIPVEINWFIFGLGVIGTLGDLSHLWEHVIGLISVGGFLAILYYATGGRGIGGGDVKLMAAAGLLVGWKNILLALMLGAILGSVIHIARMRISGQEHMLAFGPYLAAGITIVMLYGEPVIRWYLGICGIHV